MFSYIVNIIYESYLSIGFVLKLIVKNITNACVYSTNNYYHRLVSYDIVLAKEYTNSTLVEIVFV